jgi:hypothetical protein
MCWTGLSISQFVTKLEIVAHGKFSQYNMCTSYALILIMS